jgi:enoyl-CoA hydratase
MTDKLRVSRDGPVTTLIINRPEVRNALDCETARALAQALKAFEADESARVAVLTGSGQAFCAGADLKELASGVPYEPWAGSESGPLHRVLNKPVIAAVSGMACAGGLGVALWCDIRLADETAKFAVLSRRWGVPMSDGTTVRLPRIVGMGRALDMMLTARAVEAQEALQMGLVTRVVPAGQAVVAAQALALSMAAFPQVAMRSDRRSTYEQWDLLEAQAIAHENELSLQARQLEATEGARRFAAGAGRHGQVHQADQRAADGPTDDIDRAQGAR